MPSPQNGKSASKDVAFAPQCPHGCPHLRTRPGTDQDQYEAEPLPGLAEVSPSDPCGYHSDQRATRDELAVWHSAFHDPEVAVPNIAAVVRVFKTDHPEFV